MMVPSGVSTCTIVSDSLPVLVTGLRPGLFRPADDGLRAIKELLHVGALVQSPEYEGGDERC